MWELGKGEEEMLEGGGYHFLLDAESRLLHTHAAAIE